jgi:hypothetical protein
MEGADLNRKGLLKFPNGVAVIFSDNSPGWKMQEDFYQTPREPGRNYGIYYHHALWGSGPHLVQAVSPWKTYAIMRQAVERSSHWYAILNVSNVREFALGLDASARMLRNSEDFDPDRFLRRWCQERFGASAPAAESAYRKFFAAYLESPKTGTPDLLDGLALHAGERLLGGFEKARPQPELLERVSRQRAALEQATANVPGEFFQTNFTAQRGILIGILKWVECAAMAVQDRERGDTAAVAAELRRARSALQEVRSAQAMTARGDFRDWYRGDRKMDLARAERLTAELIKTYAH